jgi:hypothetical protein
MHATQIGDWDLEDRMEIDHRPIVVQFFRTGDKGQDVARAEFEYLSEGYPEAPFYELDLLENPSLARKYRLSRGHFMTSPVTMVFVDGIEQTRHVGPLITRTVERILGHRDDGLDAEEEQD